MSAKRRWLAGKGQQLILTSKPSMKTLSEALMTAFVVTGFMFG
jgi:hypothetical protein